MESKRMFLVVCVIGCAVSCIKADGHLPTPTYLTSNITRNECGKTKLCLETPKGCDPSDSSQCFFTSVTLTNISLTVELSGSSTGYIALAARESSNVSQVLNIIFVCGNNGNFFFRTTRLFNDTLQITNTPTVSSIQFSIQSSWIQCVFSIHMDGEIIHFLSNVIGLNFSISNIANSQIPVVLDILKGSTNGTALGAPTSVLESSVLVNLANVNSTKVTSTPASTPTSTPTSTPASTPTSTPTSTPASTPTSTPTSTPASTPTSTPTSTTTKTTAHSNASISLTSLLSHATICFLGISLHLI